MLGKISRVCLNVIKFAVSAKAALQAGDLMQLYGNDDANSTKWEWGVGIIIGTAVATLWDKYVEPIAKSLYGSTEAKQEDNLVQDTIKMYKKISIEVKDHGVKPLNSALPNNIVVKTIGDDSSVILLEFSEPKL